MDTDSSAGDETTASTSEPPVPATSSTAPAEETGAEQSHHPGRGQRWDFAARGINAMVEHALVERRASEEASPKGVQLLLQAMGTCVVREPSLPGTEQELRLWIAAREGRPDEVRAALEAGARVDWELPESHPLTIVYKNRRVCSQPLHAAAFFQGGGKCPQGGWPQSEEVVRLLLEARAIATATAKVSADLYRRFLQAVHLAAGVGNTGTIRLLVQSNADPDAAAISDSKVHYLPIHDAVWFNRENSVRCLIEVKASACGVNMLGETCLHLAAKLGYVGIVGWLLERTDCQDLVAHKDKSGSTPFDQAVENGQFPPRELGLFTLHLEQEERARAFIKVARACPAAAAALLRPRGDEEASAQVDDEWRRSLQTAARKGKITIQDFASLIQHAPQAAMDLMDVLTEMPEVKDQQHHPLPIRARLPPNHPCAVSCAYELDDVWEWTPWRKEHQGGQPWHHDFAPPDAKRGHEVRIRVLRLPGVIEAEVLSSMAEAQDLRIFTKLVVHALLMFCWRNLKWIFIASFVHEIIASSILCIWVWWTVPADPRNETIPTETIRRLMWSCVASQGISDGVMTILAALRCWHILGRERLLQWLTRMWFRLVVDACTVVLAHDIRERHWPRDGSEDSAMMAVNSLLHGVHVLYQLRAFQWSGQRLLPIMKSVQPIAGMLVIMLFLVLGFLNAFWAMDRKVAGDIRIFDVVIFLLTGESFLGSEDLGQMDPRQRTMSIVLTVFASFFFIAIALNVFIAVLSDCYDQEQERMVCSFLKERARICSTLFLWPSWDCLHKRQSLERNATSNLREAEPDSLPSGGSRTKRWAYLLMFLTTALMVGAVLTLSFDVDSWWGAVLLSIGLLIAQVQLRHELTRGWNERYLWLCHDMHVEEDMFLAPDRTGTVETYGRIAVIKRYIHDQCKSVSVEGRVQASHLQKGVDDCYEELSALRSEVRSLTQALSRAVGGLAPEPEASAGAHRAAPASGGPPEASADAHHTVPALPCSPRLRELVRRDSISHAAV